MYSELKQVFGKKIPLRSLMEDELYEAETKLLKAQSGMEWASANVTYETNRVARLKQLLNSTAPQAKALKIQSKDYEPVRVEQPLESAQNESVK